MEKAGGKLDELFLTRRNYDVFVFGSAYDFETVGAIKMLIMLTGSFDKAIILEEIDFNKIAKKALEISSFFVSHRTLEFLNKENISNNKLFK